VLTDSSLKHIKFWKDNLTEVNGKQFTSDLSCQSIIYSDVSNTGYGGYVVETTGINDTTNVISFVIGSSRNPFYINESIMLHTVHKNAQCNIANYWPSLSPTCE
jgi:hypothetical protein